MSCISSKKSPTSSNGSGVAQNRSILEIVRSLKGSFLDSDFEAAVVELKSREDGLRSEKMEKVEKCDVLEGKLGKLNVERFDWWVERSRLMRKCQVSDDKLNELMRELSSMREKEGDAVKRYSSLHNEVWQMEEVNKDLMTMYSDSRDEVEALRRELREKEYALEEYADSAIVSHVNEPKCPSKLNKQSLEALQKVLDFKEEFKSKDGAAVDDKIEIINLGDSDDENENALPVGVASNKRKFPGSNSEQRNDDSCIDNTLNPKHKMIKSETTPCKQVKQESSFATFSGAKNDRNYNASQKGTLLPIRRCIADHKKQVSGSRCFSEDNGKEDDGNKYTYGTTKSLSPEAEEYMISLQKKKESRKSDCRAKMMIALDGDNDLCAKGVCALYRQQTALPSGISGSFGKNQRN